MKSYEEMTRRVLAERDAILRKRRKRRAVLLCCLPVVCCAAAVCGIGQYLNRTAMTVQQSALSAVDMVSEPVITERDGQPLAAAGAQAAEPVMRNADTEQAGASGVPVLTEPSHAVPQSEPPENPLPDEMPQTEPDAAAENPQPSVQTGPVGTELTEADACPDSHTYRPWNELAVNQQYFGADIGAVYYQTAEQEVAAEEIGDYLCEAFMSGYDFYDAAADRYAHCYAKAFSVRGRGTDEAIAVQFAEGGAYYLYEHPESCADSDGLTD